MDVLVRDRRPPTGADPAAAGPSTAAVVVVIVAMLPATSGLLAVVPSQSVPAVGPSQTSWAEGSVRRKYEVTAINVVIPRNRWGDVDPHGQTFVLGQDKQAVRHWATPVADPISEDPAGGRRLRPRPLVLRANESECVEITLRNELDRRASVPAGSPPAYGSVELGGEGLPRAGTEYFCTIHPSMVGSISVVE